jgi:SAM-dependent methyltransferase
MFHALGDQRYRLAADRKELRDEEASDRWLLRADSRGAYPINGGIPILLGPEMIVSRDNHKPLDTSIDPYREAYVEMDFYNSVAKTSSSEIRRSNQFAKISPLIGRGDFPDSDWIDAPYDRVSMEECYRFLMPMRDARALQLGGSGQHVIRFLLAGADQGWLLTPMLGEAIFAVELARALGVADKFQAVVGIAEELPFLDSSFDRVISAGCIHHTVTERAFPELRRTLKLGGRFAASEPWRAPMYGIGKRILGQREQPVFGNRNNGVICRPLEAGRVAPLFETFDSAAVNHHGTFTRYPLIALGKFGLQPKPELIDRIIKADDRLAARMALADYGSSASLLAQK